MRVPSKYVRLLALFLVQVLYMPANAKELAFTFRTCDQLLAAKYQKIEEYLLSADSLNSPIFQQAKDSCETKSIPFVKSKVTDQEQFEDHKNILHLHLQDQAVESQLTGGFGRLLSCIIKYRES